MDLRTEFHRLNPTTEGSRINQHELFFLCSLSNLIERTQHMSLDCDYTPKNTADGSAPVRPRIRETVHISAASDNARLGSEIPPMAEKGGGGGGAPSGGGGGGAGADAPGAQGR